MKEEQHIPSMTPECIHEYLYKIGSEWSGKGTAVELGSWLGASAVPLLKGLNVAGYDRWFWAFDRWDVNDEQVGKAKRQGVNLFVKQDTRPLFLENVNPVWPYVKAIKGNLPKTLSKYNDDPIEICIFDAPKMDPVFSGSVEALHKLWIPGVTILGLLDYKFYMRHEGKRREEFRAPVRFMEKYGEYFETLIEWDEETSAIFFKYIKKMDYVR